MKSITFLPILFAAVTLSGCGFYSSDLVSVKNESGSEIEEVTITYMRITFPVYSMHDGMKRTLRFHPISDGNLKVSYIYNGQVFEFETDDYLLPDNNVRCSVTIMGEMADLECTH